MRRYLFLISAAILLVPSAAATEPGTYRPGMPYASVPADGAEICSDQCAGDAQCRGWNFVRVNPQNPNGLCEFNAQEAAPVPSPISISGENFSAVRSARIVPGRSKTVRVGSPAVSKPSPRRRVVREPIPQQKSTRQAVHRAPNSAPGMSLTEQQNRYRQGLAKSPSRKAGPAQAPQAKAPHPARPQMHQQRRQPMPQQAQRQAPRAAMGQPQPPMPNRAAPNPRAPQMAARRMAPNFAHNLDAGRMAGQPHPQQHMQVPQNMQAPQHMRPRGGDPRLQQRLMRQQQQQSQQPMQARQQQAQPQQQAHARPPARPPQVTIPPEMSPQNIPAAMAGAPRQTAAPALTAEQAQQSLFGSLYDDVKIPVPVDPAVAADPNAPIPTVASIPSAPIVSGPLAPPRN